MSSEVTIGQEVAPSTLLSVPLRGGRAGTSPSYSLTPPLSRGAAAAERAAHGHAGGCLLLPISRPGTKGRKRDGERVVSGGRGFSQALSWGRGGGTARGQNMSAAWGGPEG